MIIHAVMKDGQLIDAFATEHEKCEVRVLDLDCSDPDMQAEIHKTVAHLNFKANLSAGIDKQSN